MTFGRGFGEQTATVYRGAGKTKTTVGTVSIHVQPMSAQAIASGGGLFPINLYKGFIKGALSISIYQGDFLVIGSESYTVLDVKTYDQAVIVYTSLVLEGKSGG